MHLSQDARSREELQAFEDLWNVPVYLAQEKTGFKLMPGVWEQQNPFASPELKETLKGLAERVDIEHFNDAPLSYVIKARLPKALQAQAFEADDIAKVLNLNEPYSAN